MISLSGSVPQNMPIKKLHFCTSAHFPTTQYILWPFKPGLGNSDNTAET